MYSQCGIEERRSQPTLCIKTRAPVTQLDSVLPEAFEEVIRAVRAQGASVVGAPYVAYRNMDLNDLDMEIGFAVSRPLEGQRRVVPGTLPGGQWASTLHVGGYDQVERAWNKLQRFVADKDLRVTGPGYEFYFDGASTSPQRARTLVSVPVAQ